MVSVGEISPKGFDPCGLDTPTQDLDALRDLLLRAARSRTPGDRSPVRVVEVGSWAGRTALNFLRAAAAGLDVRVYCVDHWRGSPDDRTGLLAGECDVWAAFCRNAGRRLFDTVIPCVGESLEWAKVWPFAADLVFLDAGHDYDSVRADIDAWATRVRPGGVLCGHDYGVPGFEGVTRAVDESGFPGRAGRHVWYAVI